MYIPEPIKSFDQKPDVVVTVTGLLLLRFDSKGGFCEIGIHPDPLHQLRLGVEYWQRKSKGDELIEHWERSGKLTDDLQIKAVNPQTPGLSQYQSGAKLNREKLVEEMTEKEKRDFRWAVNLRQFHEPGTDLTVKAETFKPKIRLNNGLFYSYELFAPNSPMELFKENPFSANENFEAFGLSINPALADNRLLVNTFAEVLGVNIYLQEASGKVRLLWGNKGALSPFATLPKPKPGFYYKITFNNDCRPGDTFEKCRKGDGVAKSDLPKYYEVMPNVPAEERLDLDDPSQTTTEFPCVPIIP
jgi:hypothetical protein